MGFKLKELWFPLFLLLFEAAFLVLFGTLVEYGESGAPRIPDAASILDGSAYASGSGVPQGMDSDASESIRSEIRTAKLYPFFQDIHVMIFVGFGFLMTFLSRYGYGSVAFNMLMAVLAIQWSTITSGLLSFIGLVQKGTPLDQLRIPINLETLIASDFAAAAVLITMGAVLGKASPFQLVIITFFELMFYSANEAINIFVFQAADVGGSMLIHTFGAYFGLAVSFMLYNKKASDHPHNSSIYHSDLFAMIGTLFLWLYWPSFNSALASGNAQNRAIINTYFSLTGSVISTFIFSAVFDSHRKLNMTHIQNATLAGGVAVGSVANMVIQPWGALLIGFLAGFVSVVGYQYFSPTMDRWFYLQDTCGVHNLHGLPGVFSGLASALVASVAEEIGGRNKAMYGNSLFVVFPARAPSNMTLLTAEQMELGIEAGEDRHAGTQAGYQLALLGSTLLVSIFGGLLTGLIVRWRCFQAKGSEYFFDDAPYWNLPDEDEQTPLILEREELASIHSEKHGSRTMLPLHILPPSDEGYVVKNVQVDDETEGVEKKPGKGEEEVEEEGEKEEVEEEEAGELEEVEREEREKRASSVASGVEKIQVVAEVH